MPALNINSPITSSRRLKPFSLFLVILTGLLLPGRFRKAKVPPTATQCADTIGARSNIQDGSVLHVTHASDFNPDGFALSIGADVTVGHKVILHGCTIGNHCLIGMGAIVMDGAVVNDHVFIGADITTIFIFFVNKLKCLSEAKLFSTDIALNIE